MVTPYEHQIPVGITKPILSFSHSGPDRSGEPDDNASARKPESARSRRRVLIVDDNATNAGVLAGLMEDRQYEFVLAAEGKRAIELFKAEKFDLVFMDIHMPNVDGLEAAKQMREFELAADTPHTPILAVSAYDDPSIENSCEAVGMDGFIAKPVNPATLDRFLHIWIDGSR